MSEIKVNSIKGTGASTAAITVNSSDGTCTANITSVGGNQLANRNKIINGAMQVAQRGTSFTPSGTEQPFTLDRFQHIGTSGINFDSTDTQSTDHPDGFSFSMKITPDSTDTPTGSGNATIKHRIEGQDMQDLAYGTSSAKQVTLSFYAKSSSQNNGHQYGVELVHFDSSTARRQINQSFTITSSWQRFTLTFDGDTSNDIANNNGVGFEVNFHLASGPDDIVTRSSWHSNNLFNTPSGQSNFLDNTSNEFYLTGVQLEVGSVATDFEHSKIGDELRRCYRYFQRLTSNDNYQWVSLVSFYANTEIHGFLKHFETMRAIPTLSVTTGSNTFAVQRAGGAVSWSTGIIKNGGDTNMTYFYRDGVTMGTSGQCGRCLTWTAGSTITLDAEL